MKTRVLQAFREETGDEPSAELDQWEICLVATLIARELAMPKKACRGLEALLLQTCTGLSVQSCWEQASIKCGVSTRRVSPSQTDVDRAHRLDTILAFISEAETHVMEEPLQPTVRSRSRSRSRARQTLRSARDSLRLEMTECSAVSEEIARVAGKLMSVGERLDRGEGAARLPVDIRAPACFGPPAFFPVGNSAGRHPPLTQGLNEPAPRLLFVGLSDMRHVFAALGALERDVRPSCVVNDLNAETCARNAVVCALCRHSSNTPREQRVLSAFLLWWSHELPVASLGLLAEAATSAAAHGCCDATIAILHEWALEWKDPSHSVPLRDLPEVFRQDFSSWNLQHHVDCLIASGGVDNITLQHRRARLDYGLYKERVPPQDYDKAGDGVLLWPERGADEEFATDDGQPSRQDYLGQLSRNLLPFLDKTCSLAQEWFEPDHVQCHFVSGDCLRLPSKLVDRVGSIHRVFTSNVADHVGVPALALSLGRLLCVHGQLWASLSNNLRALDSAGDVRSLFQKLHGVSLEDGAVACGLRALPGDSTAPDLVFLQRPSEGSVSMKHVLTWPAECARRLYRCPPPDPHTVARRAAQGECLGMAHRYTRRFTVSPMTVGVIASLIERAVPSAETTELERSVCEAAPHAQRQLSLCLGGSCPSRTLSFRVSSVAAWARKTHPPVVLLLLRAAGMARAVKKGMKLAPADPIWAQCRTRGSLDFLRAGAWGILGWALAASPEEVQIFDGIDVEVRNGEFRVSFALPDAEVEYGVGSALFLVSTVDNTIVSGPHRFEEMCEDTRQ